MSLTLMHSRALGGGWAPCNVIFFLRPQYVALSRPGRRRSAGQRLGPTASWAEIWGQIFLPDILVTRTEQPATRRLERNYMQSVLGGSR